MRMSSIYYEGMFETRNYIIPDKALYKKHIEQKDKFWTKLREFLGSLDVVCSEIILNHHVYKKGELVVLALMDGENIIKVGLIDAIVVKESKVYLVTRRFTASRREIGYYETEKAETESTFTDAETLVDKKPLIMRGTVSKFHFVLHHHLSFNNS